MIDLADNFEEMREFCRTITAQQLQAILNRRGHDFVVADKTPEEAAEEAQAREYAILDPVTVSHHSSYWTVDAVTLDHDPGVVFEVRFAKGISWDLSDMIQNTSSPDVVVLVDAPSYAAANSSELALAA